MKTFGATLRPTTLPSAGVVLGGALWGVFWLPMRLTSDGGLTGGWPSALIYFALVILLIPLLIVRRKSVLRHWRELGVAGLFTGAAVSFYSTSLVLTDVVHAILLFYLTPVWGTLLGIFVLEERLTRARAAALALGLVGLVVVLGGEGLPWPRNPGDWLALASGVLWAQGTLKLYRMKGAGVSDQILGFAGGSLIATLATIAIGGPALGGVPDLALLAEAAPMAILTALFILPMLALIIWPATLLTPARVGLLLMSEVIVGVASSAALTDETFGFREAVGAALIIGAGLVEVLGRGGEKSP